MKARASTNTYHLLPYVSAATRVLTAPVTPPHLHHQYPVDPGQGLLNIVSRQLLVGSRGGPANGTQEPRYMCVFGAVVGGGVVCRCC